MSSTETGGRLVDERLVELLSLVNRSDSVEMKLTVPEAAHRSTVVGLGMDPLAAQIRQVFFFDTPDLALNRAGVVARARRIQAKGGDSVIKLRPVVPDELPEDLRRSPGMVVEVDAMPNGFVCSASLKGRVEDQMILDAAAGRQPIRKVFTKEQRAFYAAHAPEGLELDSLAVLGPIFVLKLNFVPEGWDGRMVAEMWFYPDGSQILELSTKSLPADALHVGLALRSFLRDKGVEVTDEQQTKTKTALEFFSSQLQSAANP
ncbi:MAG TPA: hypothetical protein VH419_17555 [Nocardioidaceae bacterium]|jgi:hypothetical protein